jgi:hypothetical protein
MEGFATVLSPSFFLWADIEDNLPVRKYSSLLDIWDAVGEHIDDATDVVISSKDGGKFRRIKQRRPGEVAARADEKT